LQLALVPRACEASILLSSDSLLISRLKTATGRGVVDGRVLGHVMASAVLPIEGRAAM